MPWGEGKGGVGKGGQPLREAGTVGIDGYLCDGAHRLQRIIMHMPLYKFLRLLEKCTLHCKLSISALPDVSSL